MIAIWSKSRMMKPQEKINEQKIWDLVKEQIVPRVGEDPIGQITKTNKYLCLDAV